MRRDNKKKTTLAESKRDGHKLRDQGIKMLKKAPPEYSRNSTKLNEENGLGLHYLKIHISVISLILLLLIHSEDQLKY